MGKFVGVVAALAVLAMPAAALVSCWTPMAMGPACPHCAGMMGGSSSDTLQAAPSGTSCCDLSSGKPAPASELSVPAATALAAPQAHSSAIAISPPPRHVELSLLTSASPPASFQAVLCTFLI